MKILKSLVIVFAMAALVGGLTGAYFSDQKKIEGNTVAAGTLYLEVGHGELKPWTISNFAPGYTTEWEQASTTNTGSISGNLAIYTQKTDGDDALYDALNIEVREGSSEGLVLYDGPINGASIGPYSLDPEQTRIGWQRVYMPDSGEKQNDLQGLSVTFDEIFDLTQP